MSNDLLIDFDTFKRAAENRIGLNETNAFDLTFRVMSYFGFGNELIDNYLNPEDRRLFYFLQDLELLRTHWDESILVSGRGWRIFYWNLNTDKILQAATPVIEMDERSLGIYETLPDSLWAREVEAE